MTDEKQVGYANPPRRDEHGLYGPPKVGTPRWVLKILCDLAESPDATFDRKHSVIKTIMKLKGLDTRPHSSKRPRKNYNKKEKDKPAQPVAPAVTSELASRMAAFDSSKKNSHVEM